MRYPRITAIILAGGRGSRLGGVSKATLPLPGSPGATLLSAQLDLFAGRFAATVVVLAPDQPDPIPSRPGLAILVARDRLAGAGPLAGIEAGLCAAATSSVFVCAVDMPALRAGLIDWMADRVREGRALVPRRAGRPEPLHAFYPRECLPIVTELLDRGERAPRELLARLPVDWLDEQDREGIEGAEEAFDSLNTPEDLARAGIPPAPRRP